MVNAIDKNCVVLFLDFDGVLHSRGGATAGERFSKRPMLEALLRESDLQHVVIVIASTWREVYPLRELASIFSNDIRPRIIDTTPTLSDTTSDYLRYREIREWLNLHSTVSRWVALDDAVEDFPHSKRGNLIFTNPDIGLESGVISRLRDMLKSS
jgi:hypothetical protein